MIKCNVCEKQNELYFLLTCSTSIINHADIFFLVGLEEKKMCDTTYIDW